jgi:murein DD-endopeptidase MepM/ murein hydrolase activator NlpD
MQTSPLRVKELTKKVVTHHRFRTVVGVNLVLVTLYLGILQPSPAGAQNGRNEARPETVSDGEASLTTKTSVQMPLTSFTLTQKYWLLHSGLDLAAPAGTAVKPIAAGVVETTKTGWFGYGNLVVIRHGKDFESWYGHLSRIDVREGQSVGTQTIIGEVGSTGRSTGPHLHLEIHEDGKTIDPAPILGIR